MLTCAQMHSGNATLSIYSSLIFHQEAARARPSGSYADGKPLITVFMMVRSILRHLSCGQELRLAAADGAAGVEAKCRACLAARKPLVRHSITQQPAIKQYTPRFEEDFARNKDYDPDRQAFPCLIVLIHGSGHACLPSPKGLLTLSCKQPHAQLWPVHVQALVDCLLLKAERPVLHWLMVRGRRMGQIDAGIDGFVRLGWS